MRLEAAEEHLDGCPPALARHLASAQETARSCLNDTRRAVAALRPESLDGACLPAALTDIYLKWTGTETDVIALRVVQEALVNAAKHAQAEEVTVTLAYGRGELRVSVHDDGSGFDFSKSLQTNGFGVVTMRERVASVGGNLSIASEPGRGTTVTAILPNSRERE